MLVSPRVEPLFDADTFRLQPEALAPVRPAVAGRKDSGVILSVFDDLAPIEADWRAFERRADCTVFQTFEWQSAWLRHIGSRASVTPAIVVGRGRDGDILFLLPLAVEGGAWIRRLTWLASDLCDYNGPLLARDFGARFDVTRLVALCREIEALLQAHPRLRHDAIELTKMPAMVGGQANPFVRLPVMPNPSGAYLATLTDDWDSFYFEKRSSATRRRNRIKRQRLAEIGPVGYVTSDDANDTRRVLDILFAQKAKTFARKGVADLLARPECADFFKDVATNPAMRNLVHVSRLDVGAIVAAANFGLVFRGRYYHILASYDDGDVARFGPGAAHLNELMRFAIEQGCREFDFTIGDESYKRDWADIELVLYDHRAAVNLRGLAFAIPAEALARAKRLVKQTPFLWRATCRARALAGRLTYGGRGNAAADELAATD